MTQTQHDTAVPLKPFLLVENDPFDVDLTLAALAEANLANAVHVVEDGEEALDYLECRGKYALRPKGNPAAILLDLKMPKINGHEVLESIRSSVSLRQIPVIILSGSSEKDDVSRVYAAGGNSYVVKPVIAEEFRRAVAEVGLYWGVTNVCPPGSVKNCVQVKRQQ
jgi:CheY-like chemotaxis protein